MKDTKKTDERRGALLKYVQKSNLVLNMLPNVNPDDPKLKATKDAILQGNFRAQIFSDPDCHLYIVYLIQNKLISYSEGVTAYTFLLILMSYSSEPPLKPEDSHLKHQRFYTLVSLVETNSITQKKELTSEGQSYLENLFRWMETFNESDQPINKESIIDFLFSLPPIEQSLIKLKFNPSDFMPNISNNGIDATNLNLIALAAPIIGFTPLNSGLLLSLPSASIIDFMLHAITMDSPNTVLPLYGMGILSQDTLYELEQKSNFRFTSLYSPGVKKNLLEGHLNIRDPFEILFHDIYHCVVSNLVNDEEKSLLNNKIVPMLRNLAEECARSSNIVAQEIASNLKEFFMDNDYGDAELRGYMQPNYKYLRKLLNNKSFWGFIPTIFTRCKSVTYIDSQNEKKLLAFFQKFAEKIFSDVEILQNLFLLTACKKIWQSLLTYCEQHYERVATLNFLSFFDNPPNSRRDTFIKKVLLIWDRQAKQYNSRMRQESDRLDLSSNYHSIFNLGKLVELTPEDIEKLDLDFDEINIVTVEKESQANTNLLTTYQKIVDEASFIADSLPTDLATVVAIYKAQQEILKKMLLLINIFDNQVLLQFSFLIFGNFNLFMTPEQIDNVIEQMINQHDIKKQVSELLKTAADITTLLNKRKNLIDLYRKLSNHKRTLRELNNNPDFEIAYLNALFHILGELIIQDNQKNMKENIYSEMISREQIISLMLEGHAIDPGCKNAMVQLGFVKQLASYKQNHEYIKAYFPAFATNLLDYEINFEEIRQKLHLPVTLVEFVNLINEYNSQLRNNLLEVSPETLEYGLKLFIKLGENIHNLEESAQSIIKETASIPETSQAKLKTCYEKNLGVATQALVKFSNIYEKVNSQGQTTIVSTTQTAEETLYKY